MKTNMPKAKDIARASLDDATPEELLKTFLMLTTGRKFIDVKDMGHCVQHWADNHFSNMVITLDPV